MLGRPSSDEPGGRASWAVSLMSYSPNCVKLPDGSSVIDCFSLAPVLFAESIPSVNEPATKDAQSGEDNAQRLRSSADRLVPLDDRAYTNLLAEMDYAAADSDLDVGSLVSEALMAAR